MPHVSNRDCILTTPMLNHLRNFHQRLAASLWYVPAIIVLGAGLLAGVLIDISSSVERSVLVRFPRLFGADAQSSRSMLATIAGSMITVAGVTFSLTVLAVAQASSQYTPRILRNFMRDRASQTTLGFLVGVFVYCLIVIRTIRGDEDVRFVPSLAVLGGLALALGAIGFLIAFHPPDREHT